MVNDDPWVAGQLPPSLEGIARRRRQHTSYGVGTAVAQHTTRADQQVGSGGVLRHGGPDAVRRVLTPATGDAFEGGWQLPRDPRVAVDHDYVLAAAGLLAEEHPVAAHRLLGGLAAAGDR